MRVKKAISFHEKSYIPEIEPTRHSGHNLIGSGLNQMTNKLINKVLNWAEK